MSAIDTWEWIYIIWSLLFHLMLTIHFAVRKKYFQQYTLRYGWLVYAMSIPACAVSIILLIHGKHWSLAAGGFLFLLWGLYGYRVDYIQKIEWRSPALPSIMVPYLILYLATVMFFWWPLALFAKPFWYIAAVLFGINTWLNLRSH